MPRRSRSRAAQLVLQGLDLLAQGRLGPEGGLGRFGEAPQFRHLVKAQELLPFHKYTLINIIILINFTYYYF